MENAKRPGGTENRDYRLLTRGILPGGEVVELGGYPFRVTSGG